MAWSRSIISLCDRGAFSCQPPTITSFESFAANSSIFCVFTVHAITLSDFAPHSYIRLSSTSSSRGNIVDLSTMNNYHDETKCPFIITSIVLARFIYIYIYIYLSASLLVLFI